MSSGTLSLPLTGVSVERTPLVKVPSADINPWYRQAALKRPPNSAVSIRNLVAIKIKMPVMLFGSDPSMAPYLSSIPGSPMHTLGLSVPLMLAVNIAVINPIGSSLILFISLLRVAWSVTSQMIWTSLPVKVSLPEAKVAVALISILVLAVDMPAASDSTSAVTTAVMTTFVKVRIEHPSDRLLARALVRTVDCARVSALSSVWRNRRAEVKGLLSGCSSCLAGAHERACLPIRALDDPPPGFEAKANSRGCTLDTVFQFVKGKPVSEASFEQLLAQIPLTARPALLARNSV
jgi:hypothetical protein